MIEHWIKCMGPKCRRRTEVELSHGRRQDVTRAYDKRRWIIDHGQLAGSAQWCSAKCHEAWLGLPLSKR